MIQSDPGEAASWIDRPCHRENDFQDPAAHDSIYNVSWTTAFPRGVAPAFAKASAGKQLVWMMVTILAG